MTMTINDRVLLDRSMTPLVFHPPKYRRTELPLVTLRCEVCSELVDVLGDPDTFAVSRVNGDSKYGYEPYHLVVS